MTKKQAIIMNLVVLALCSIVLGTSYALFTSRQEGTKELVFDTGTFKVEYRENGNIIQVANAYPMTETEGMRTDEYSFSVTNKGTFAALYKIYLEEETGATNTVSKDKIKLSWKKNSGNYNSPQVLSTLNNLTLLENQSLAGGKSDTYGVKLWLDESATNEEQGKSYKFKIVVEAVQALSADKTFASAPELEDNMIPVKYDETAGSWIKADANNPETNPWYQYQNKMWANAVVVKETGTKTRVEYQAAEVGTEIPMDDILQMLVWIPRYKYAMPAAKEGQIDIVFEKKNATKSTGTATGTSYLTHPAFTFGKTELNGLWVGKFESSSNIVCTPDYDGSQGTSCDLTTIQPQIKPNVKSWTGARVSTFFTASRDMQTVGNPYGYNQSGVDSHMMKNSEWGAVAYLTQSKYGRCMDGVCTEVTMNNLNSGDGSTITGCAADTISAAEVKQADCPAANKYNTEKGVLASTTGNVYGIYDMAGGNWEYVMGSYKKYSGYTAISYTTEQAKTILGRTDNIAVGVWNSGFNGPVHGKALDNTTSLSWTTGIDFPEEKYYDLYTTSNASTSCNSGPCLGHALSETAGWYSDSQNHVSPSVPWFVRGGLTASDSNTGILSFSRHFGKSQSTFAFRLVVSKE